MSTATINAPKYMVVPDTITATQRAELEAAKSKYNEVSKQMESARTQLESVLASIAQSSELPRGKMAGNPLFAASNILEFSKTSPDSTQE